MSKQKKHISKKPVAASAKKELRSTLNGSRLEVREQNDGTKKLKGYAAVFNSAADIGSFIEIIAPGAFTQTLREDDQVMLRDHQSELLLGRRSAGTLKLTQDSVGLAFELTLPNTSLGQDTYENVRLGNLKGCSMGFIVRSDTWTQDADGNLTRVITDVLCLETTLTAFPAYAETSIDIRSIRAKLKSKRDHDLDDDSDCDPDVDDDCEDDEEDRCECTCGFAGCASLDDSEDENDEERQKAAHLSLLMKRLKS